MPKKILSLLFVILMLGACAPTIPGETVSQEEFDRLKTGMTYGEIVATIGGEPHDPTGYKGGSEDRVNILHAQPEFGGSIGLIMRNGKLHQIHHQPPTDGPLVAPSLFGSFFFLCFAVFSTFYYFYKKNWPDAERKQPRLWKRIMIASWIIGVALWIILVIIA